MARLIRPGLAVAGLVGALAVTPVAYGHGDPASDVLAAGWVSLPISATVSKPVAARLQTVAREARANGYAIKVALIAAPSDLGPEYLLWHKPQQYARFLGGELILYKQRLLVVMPNGFGLYHARHAVPERSTLTGLQVPPNADGLANAAVNAVARLAAEAGHRLAVPPPGRVHRHGTSQTRDRLILVSAGGIAAALIAVSLWRRRR